MRDLPKIVRNPQILCGKPTIEGTRISVELILSKLGGGWTEAEIYESYPHLPKNSVRAACAWGSAAVSWQFQKKGLMKRLLKIDAESSRTTR